MSPWVQDPNSGGVKIPERVRERVKQRILKYAEAHLEVKRSHNNLAIAISSSHFL